MLLYISIPSRNGNVSHNMIEYLEEGRAMGALSPRSPLLAKEQGGCRAGRLCSWGDMRFRLQLFRAGPIKPYVIKPYVTAGFSFTVDVDVIWLEGSECLLKW